MLFGYCPGASMHHIRHEDEKEKASTSKLRVQWLILGYTQSFSRSYISQDREEDQIILFLGSAVHLLLPESYYLYYI